MRQIQTITKSAFDAAPALCTACGLPFDAQYFDVSDVFLKPRPGETATLAEFELPPQYCGVLEYFAQFTDEYALNNSKIETPDVEWSILADGSPLFPYLSFRRIVNPWGEGAFPVAVRLPEGVRIKFIARGVSGVAPSAIKQVGGRLLGRFWYNATGGDAIRRRY
ncbi:MAG TPA: hypothetical protein VG324_29525 [Blastocatellia bacterium]|nr:hypothetical protein [Blastocatellia bacterium]